MTVSTNGPFCWATVDLATQTYVTLYAPVPYPAVVAGRSQVAVMIDFDYI